MVYGQRTGVVVITNGMLSTAALYRFAEIIHKISYTSTLFIVYPVSGKQV